MWGWDEQPQRVLGVFVAVEAVFLTELERIGDGQRFRVRQCRQEKIKAPGALWDNARVLAEGVMRLCMTYGLSYKYLWNSKGACFFMQGNICWSITVDSIRALFRVLV